MRLGTSSQSGDMFKRSRQITQGVGTSRASTSESFSDLLVYEGQNSDFNADDTFAILHWWKENAHSMPILSLVARDVLAAPASTVSSESAFSSGGRVINDHRHSLKEETVEACVCIKDWRDAEVRRQADPHIWWPDDSESSGGSHESTSPPDMQP